MRSFPILFFLATIVAVALTSNVEDHQVISQVVDQIRTTRLDCRSWRLSVETNNLRDWPLVPEQCANYVARYMTGRQYGNDCEQVAKSAIEYAKSLKPCGDGKDVWVFDVDETTLSNLPFFARFDYGALPLNDTEFAEWILKGKLPAIPSMLGVYNTVLSLGFKPVFITGAIEAFRPSRIVNLNEVGYSNWEKLIVRGENDTGSAVEFKSSKRTELVNGGYRIWGNMGDQWSDLIGENVGARTFKVPNPMMYVG